MFLDLSLPPPNELAPKLQTGNNHFKEAMGMSTTYDPPCSCDNPPVSPAQTHPLWASQCPSELGTSRNSHSILGGEQLLLKDKCLPR